MTTRALVGGAGRPVALSIALLALAGAAWVALLASAVAMPMGDGPARLADVFAFLAVWVAMMAGMMFPAALPMTTLYAAVSGSRPRTAIFLSGYMVVWSAFGLAAYAANEVAGGRLFGMGGAGGLGRVAAAIALGLAALYQVSPLKGSCLARCRAPLSRIVNGWHDGPVGALRMGAGHGLWCAGCCAGLMLVLLTVGVMSLTWMAILALVILGEKVAPFGVPLSHVAAVAIGALAVAVAIDPGAIAWLR